METCTKKIKFYLKTHIQRNLRIRAGTGHIPLLIHISDLWNENSGCDFPLLFNVSFVPTFCKKLFFFQEKQCNTKEN